MAAELTGTSWTCVASGTGSCAAPSGEGSISTTVSLPSGEHATCMLTATVKSSATGSVANTATVTAPAGVTDTAGNNTATDTDTIVRCLDLTIVNIGYKGSVVAGTSTTYTIVVTN